VLDFESSIVDAGETAIHVERGGSAPAVLLLHGFPETLAMWRAIASLLAERFSVVGADLHGYGAGGCPPSTGDHAPYSKRALARDMVSVMTQLGFERFSIAGHDRGGRVAYRTALDAPERVERLAVLDVVAIDAAWDRADDRLALGFWPWSLLAQPEPLPERLVGAAPEAVIDHALSIEWGTPADTFGEDARAEYLAQLRDPDHVHAICEEYRAAASSGRIGAGAHCQSHEAAVRLATESTAGSRGRGGFVARWSRERLAVAGHQASRRRRGAAHPARVRPKASFVRTAVRHPRAVFEDRVTSPSVSGALR